MTTAEKTLQTLALLDPDFPAFAAALTSEELYNTGGRFSCVFIARTQQNRPLVFQ